MRGSFGCRCADKEKTMFSDDFWNEPEQKRNRHSPITLRSFFRKIGASMQSLFAARHSPDYLDQDALGDQVTVPEELIRPGRNEPT